MRFKVDENLHSEVAALLTSRGHDAETVHAEGLQGRDDIALAQHCLHENRVIVTLDLDFADVRAFPPATLPGIIVLRVGFQSRRHILSVMVNIVNLLDQEPVSGRLWIASDAGVRIREG